MKKVVVIGGGSGLATLLRGLRDYPIDITAIVTMTDDGASSGRLRRDFKLLPPGDIRKCIAALSDDETALTDLFQYRFKSGLGLGGHSLGNLLITAMKELTGNFELAIEEVSRLLNIRGRVLPATLDDVDLVAKFDNGNVVIGESKITKYGYKHRISRISLSKKAKTNPRALSAISEADVVVIGPGSLYTSILPNFLQKKMCEALHAAEAIRVYICNVSTERGETVGFSVLDHVRELRSYKVPIDIVLANSHDFPVGVGDGFVAPVKLDLSEAEDVIGVMADIVDTKNPLYHDSHKLASVIYGIITRPGKFTKSHKSVKMVKL